jgi:hypothetical protein
MNPRLYAPLEANEEVAATVSEMQAFPPNCNPFRHDHFHMGSDLVRGWMAMHSGFDRDDEPLPLNYVILVNQRTGQRLKVELLPKTPKLRGVVTIIAADRIVDESEFYIWLDGNDAGLNWVGIGEDWDRTLIQAKAYYRHGDFMIRMEALTSYDTFQEQWERYTFSDVPERAIYDRIVARINTLLIDKD